MAFRCVCLGADLEGYERKRCYEDSPDAYWTVVKDSNVKHRQTQWLRIKVYVGGR